MSSCQYLRSYDLRHHTNTVITIIIIRPYHSTTYVDAVHCYRPSSVVCWSVTLVSPAKTATPIQMPFGLRTQVGPRNHVGSIFPMGRGNFEGRKGHPIVKYRDTPRLSVQKWLNRSRCRLGRGLRCTCMYNMVSYCSVCNMEVTDDNKALECFKC